MGFPKLAQVEQQDFSDGDDTYNEDNTIITIRQVDNGFVLTADLASGESIEEVYLNGASGPHGGDGLIHSIKVILGLL